MSRYAFSELIENLSELASLNMESDDDGEDLNTCRAGYDIQDWDNEAVLGWDNDRGTYFLSLALGGESFVWWFGSHSHEIKSPYILCAIINRLFDRAIAPFTIVFSSETLQKLINDRVRYLEGLTLDDAQQYKMADLAWREDYAERGYKYVPETYMRKCLVRGSWIDYDVRSYLPISFDGDENGELISNGARLDKSTGQLYVPFDTDILKYGKWFGNEVWLSSPSCPDSTYPLMLGSAIFELLMAWAVETRIAPERLRFWSIESNKKEFFDDGGRSVWQIFWDQGPPNWAIRLPQQRSYKQIQNQYMQSGKKFYFEPADRHILSFCTYD